MQELIKDNVEISDINLLISKGLYENDTFNNRYYVLYRNYKVLLDRYLANKLTLDSFDKSIDDSGLKFIPVNKSTWITINIYQP